MNSSPITVDATLLADGVTLCLDAKLPVAPGRVRVTVSPSETAPAPTLVDVFERIDASQRARGWLPPTEQEMADEVAQLRAGEEQYNEYWQRVWSDTTPPPHAADTP